MKQWFVEERGFDGTYRPTVYHGDKPTEKRASGHRVKFQADPKEVHRGHEGNSLDQKAESYGSNGRFTRV